MSALIPAPQNEWPGAGRRAPLHWRLKAAWAALQGHSVILNVVLRGDVDALGRSRLAITAGEGFQLHCNTYVATSGVLVNGVPLEEIDLTAQSFDVSGPESQAL
jgi:hypothetical protein